MLLWVQYILCKAGCTHHQCIRHKHSLNPNQPDQCTPLVPKIWLEIWLTLTLKLFQTKIYPWSKDQRAAGIRRHTERMMISMLLNWWTGIKKKEFFFWKLRQKLSWPDSDNNSPTMQLYNFLPAYEYRWSPWFFSRVGFIANADGIFPYQLNLPISIFFLIALCPW